MARGGVRLGPFGAVIRRNSLSLWVGGFQSIGRFRHYQSNMSRPGKSNFPIVSRSRARAHVCEKRACRAAGDASLLIDGDAFKTFKTAPKESP